VPSGPAQTNVPLTVQTLRDATAAPRVDARRPTRHGHLAPADDAAVERRRTVAEQRSDDGGHNESMRQAAIVCVELLPQPASIALLSPPLPVARLLLLLLQLLRCQ